MSNEILIAVLAGLSGMLGWGLADFFAKKTIDIVGDMVTLAMAHVFGLSVLIGLAGAWFWFSGSAPALPDSPWQWLGLAGFGVIQALVYFYAYRAFGKGKLALLNPIFSSYSGLVVLLSVFLFSEMIGSWQAICLAVIFGGILLASLDKESFALKRLKFTKIKGLRDILVATVLAAFWTVSWGNFVVGRDWFVYAAIMYAFMTLTILLMVSTQGVKLRVLHKVNWKWFLAIGISELTAYIGISLGYSLTNKTSIIAVLSAAFSIPTVILAHQFLKERVTLFQASGTLLIILGVIAISVK
jgi:drug/metabolite transporter (DMT)-like permease